MHRYDIPNTNLIPGKANFDKILWASERERDREKIKTYISLACGYICLFGLAATRGHHSWD
jgi:hypothetical protein